MAPVSYRGRDKTHIVQGQSFTVTLHLLWLTVTQACIDQGEWLGFESFLTALRSEQGEEFEAPP